MTDFINKILDYGNKLYDNTLGLIANLSGIARGLATLVVLLLALTGLIRLVKKSFKLFGFILLIVLIAIIATSFIK